MAQKSTEQEFIEAWEQHRSAARVAEVLNINERAVHHRRRRIEESTGRLLLSASKESPDYDIFVSSFPDFHTIEIANGTVLACSDWHLIPGHKSTAHRAALKLVKELKPAAFIENGDLLDFSTISKHHRLGWDKSPSVKREIEYAGDVLHEFKVTGPKAMITHRCQGNHDQRFDGYISNVAGKLEGVHGTSLSDHMPGWALSWAVNINDTLQITHRWKSGKHAVYLNTVSAGVSYATGHLHAQKVEPFTDLRGDRWGVDLGTMASIYGPQFRYLEAKPRDWRSGFAVFTFINRQLMPPELVSVINENEGLVWFRGQLIKV